MQDLNDLYYFVQVVAYSGFAAAGRALGVPKSKLSRRIALLEERLGVRLIQRSTRHFSVTEIGQSYYAHCQAMLVEAEAAQSAVNQTRTAPCGSVRITCPVALLHSCVGSMLADFLIRYPQVELKLEATNRRVDVIAEGIDVAIRARPPPLEDSQLMLKVYAEHGHVLVASPALIQQSGDIRVPADLSGRPSLDLEPPLQEHVWQLEGPHGAQARIRHYPRLVSDDMLTLRTAALAGVGIVRLPRLMVSEDLRAGSLARLLPGWAPRRDLIHAVYPSRRGLLPSVRALLNELATRFGTLSHPTD